MFNDKMEQLTTKVKQFSRKMAATLSDPVAQRKRVYRKALRAIREVDRPVHMTKTGHALLPTFKEGRNIGGSVTYQLTPREVARRKSARKQKATSRRANRSR